MKTGIELIAEERQRQIEKEGWTNLHDSEDHNSMELAGAAGCYVANAINKHYEEDSLGNWKEKARFQYKREPESNFFVNDGDRGDRKLHPGGWEDGWPWDAQWDKRKKHDKVRSLVIAGALIAAELDRLNQGESNERSATQQEPNRSEEPLPPPTQPEREQRWDDNKVIAFVNWYLKLNGIDDRHELENQYIIDSFQNGDDYKMWWANGNEPERRRQIAVEALRTILGIIPPHPAIQTLKSIQNIATKALSALPATQPGQQTAQKPFEVGREEYWSGFDYALDLLDSMYASTHPHPLNIADCIKAKVNRLDTEPRPKPLAPGQQIAGEIAEYVLRIIDTNKWYWCKCESCGWEDSSQYALGGGPIADTGDFDDPRCPVCYDNDLNGEPVCDVEEYKGVVQVKIPLNVFLAPYQKAAEKSIALSFCPPEHLSTLPSTQPEVACKHCGSRNTERQEEHFYSDGSDEPATSNRLELVKWFHCNDCGEDTHPAKMQPEVDVEELAQFVQACHDERKKFSKEMLELWLAHTPKERVAIEDLLIMYDQAVERLQSLQQHSK
jgi:hypothetical protein